ncbi:MAG: hypothetical protein ABIJ96_01660 [Elusimicrobiota bacterium]
MRRFSAAVLFLLAAGCGRTIEQEPNDHFTQATPINGKTRIEGTLRTADDVDMFRLDAAEPERTLSLHLGGIRGVDFVLSVLDADRHEIKRFDETALGGDERAFDIGLAKGVYYLRIANKNPDGGNTEQRYALELEYAGGRDTEREPNDSALQANDIVPGGVLRGHFYPSRNLLAAENDFLEEDWFRINVHKDGTYLLNVDVSEVPGVDSVLELYGPNSYKIKEVDAGGAGEPEVLSGFGIRGPVHYFLRLRSKAKNAANGAIPYQILTELIPYQGEREFESNDHRLEATPLRQDAIAGLISPAGDQDWYKIAIEGDARTLLSAQLSGAAGLDLTLTVTDEIGNPLRVIDDRGKEQPESLTGLGVARGSYYLVVAEKTGRAADARRGYTLKAASIPYPEGLEYEINDSSAAAQSIEMDRSIDGYIAPKGDQDYYTFNVYQTAEIAIDATGVLNVGLLLELYGQEGALIAQSTGGRSGEPVQLIRTLEAGTYTALLRGASPEHNNIRDKYTFRVRAR